MKTRSDYDAWLGFWAATGPDVALGREQQHWNHAVSGNDGAAYVAS